MRSDAPEGKKVELLPSAALSGFDGTPAPLTVAFYRVGWRGGASAATHGTRCRRHGLTSPASLVMAACLGQALLYIAQRLLERRANWTP